MLCTLQHLNIQNSYHDLGGLAWSSPRLPPRLPLLTVLPPCTGRARWTHRPLYLSWQQLKYNLHRDLPSHSNPQSVPYLLCHMLQLRHMSQGSLYSHLVTSLRQPYSLGINKKPRLPSPKGSTRLPEVIKSWTLAIITQDECALSRVFFNTLHLLNLLILRKRLQTLSPDSYLNSFQRGEGRRFNFQIKK